MATEAIVFTVALFVGAAVTAPQGPDPYQQGGTIYNQPNYQRPVVTRVPVLDDFQQITRRPVAESTEQPLQPTESPAQPYISRSQPATRPSLDFIKPAYNQRPVVAKGPTLTDFQQFRSVIKPAEQTIQTTEPSAQPVMSRNQPATRPRFDGSRAIYNQPNYQQPIVTGFPALTDFRKIRPVIKSNEQPFQQTEPPTQQAISRYQPSSRPKPYIKILKQSQEDNYDGSFAYSYETENGITVEVGGYLKDAGTENEAQVMFGTYTYTAPDGTPITTSWNADDTGFNAAGVHLPQPVRVQFTRSFTQEEQKSEIP